MSDESNPIQEGDIFAALVHSDEYGKGITRVVTAQMFAPPYREMVAPILAFWKDKNRAPGADIDLVVSELIVDDEDPEAKARRQLLRKAKTRASTLTDYVVDVANRFAQKRLRHDRALQLANAADAEKGLDEDDRIIRETEHKIAHTFKFDPGLRLTDTRKVAERLTNKGVAFEWGIPEVDTKKLGIGRGEIGVGMAPSGRGKSHLLNYVSLRALTSRSETGSPKVLILSLELDETEIWNRLHQMMWRVPPWPTDEPIEIPYFKRNREREVIGRGARIVRPKFTLSDDDWESKVDRRLHGVPFRGPTKRTKPWWAIPEYEPEEGVDPECFSTPKRQALKGQFLGGVHFKNNLRIKWMPPGVTTVRDIDAYMEQLEAVEGFKTDLLVVDYASKLAMNERGVEYAEIARNLEQLRNLGKERNCGVFTAHQTVRKAARANKVGEDDIEASWRAYHVADRVISFARLEKGLMRGVVLKGRKAEDGYSFGIAQCLALGWFCTDSCSGAELDALVKTKEKGDKSEVPKPTPDQIEAMKERIDEKVWGLNPANDPWESGDWFGDLVAEEMQIEKTAENVKPVDAIIDWLVRKNGPFDGSTKKRIPGRKSRHKMPVVILRRSR